MVTRLLLLSNRMNGNFIGCRLTKRVRIITPIIDPITLLYMNLTIIIISIGWWCDRRPSILLAPPPAALLSVSRVTYVFPSVVGHVGRGGCNRCFKTTYLYHENKFFSATDVNLHNSSTRNESSGNEKYTSRLQKQRFVARIAPLVMFILYNLCN